MRRFSLGAMFICSLVLGAARAASPAPAAASQVAEKVIGKPGVFTFTSQVPPDIIAGGPSKTGQCRGLPSDGRSRTLELTFHPRHPASPKRRRPASPAR